MNKKSVVLILMVYSIFLLLTFSEGGGIYAANSGSDMNIVRSDLSFEIEQKMNQRGLNVSADILDEIELTL
ncbi:MAG: hypothetical protein FWH55_06190 [Oscillospiraceae bacterium]|nr:hypothetical protein [Oscillospiraceae bacterium]